LHKHLSDNDMLDTESCSYQHTDRMGYLSLPWGFRTWRRKHMEAGCRLSP
jgi:hypothetical protein